MNPCRRMWGWAFAALALAVVLGICAGHQWAAPAEIWQAIAERDTLRGRLLWEWRMPRVLAAACVGALLGLSGAVFQGVFRNPLAEPYLLGASGGAALGATIALLVPLGLPQSWLLPGLAFAGAWGSTLLVLGVARVAGALDVTSTTGVDKFNVLEGAASGASETITFSFNRSGVIRDLLFDGIKDETLEYFQLTLPNGELLTFVDAEAEFRLTQQGFGLADLNVPHITPLVDGNDDRLGINLPFAAGDAFVLSYGNHSFPTGYVPLQNELGNGARWEGLVIVPEASGLALALCGVVAIGWARRKQR